MKFRPLRGKMGGRMGLDSIYVWRNTSLSIIRLVVGASESSSPNPAPYMRKVVEANRKPYTALACGDKVDNYSKSDAINRGLGILVVIKQHTIYGHDHNIFVILEHHSGKVAALRQWHLYRLD
jgi:hypothetical protein